MVFVRALILGAAVSGALASLKLYPDEEVQDCTVGGKSKYVDFTGLSHPAHNDTHFTVEGK